MKRTRHVTSDSRQSPRHRGTAAAWSLLTALLLGPSAAQAQGELEDRAAAEALFNEALTLIEAGAWATGCPGFERSFALYRSRSTMIQIARCRAHEGKVATAWEDYQRALRVEGPAEDAERQRALAAIATREAQALEPRLPRLRVVIVAPPPGAEVRCDGRSLPSDALGRSVPVDPGRHEVTAGAPGYRGVTRSVLSREGETVTVEMALVEASRPASGWRMPAGITLAVIGAVGLGAGAATGITSLDRVAAVRARCGGNHCFSDDTASRQDVSTAKTLADVSTASFIAGGALALTGGALLLWSRSPGGDGAAPKASLHATLGPGQISLQGRF